MRIRTCLITVIVVLFVFAGTDGRKTSGRRSSSSGGWGSSSRRGGGTRTTARPSQTNSSPGKIGWNVPPSTNNKAPSTGTSNAKPSAPVSEHASKTSASNVQSGYPSGNPPPYSPSGGYPRQPASNPYGGPGYNQGGTGYNQGGTGYNQGYPSYNNPSYPGGHSPYGQAYNPSMQHNAPPAYSPYPGGHSYGGHGGQSYGQPSYAQPSYVQPAIAQAPALTVLQPSRPGIGQLAKEALVYSSVSAGVSAAVNRLLPGGIYGRSPGYSNGAGAAAPSHTEVTYNNYYYNQSNPANGEAPANSAAANNNGGAPANSNAPSSVTPLQPPPEADKKAEATSNANSPSPQTDSNPSQPNYPISNDEVKKLAESLFEVDKNNAYKYITVNLQGETKEDSTADDAPLPLLDVKPEAYEIPTIKSVLALQDNYEMDVKKKETVTPEERKEEAELLDRFLETDVFKTMMKYLADKEFVLNDEYEFKDTLKRIWFSQFQRVEGEPSSSGFEAVFVAEKLDSYMIGPQNWIYYAKQEEQKNLDYRGYIKDIKLADKGEAIKIRTAFNVPDTKHSITTLLVGLSPELEMALYTMCFYLRPNDVCPISLGGKDVSLVSTRFNYFGKDILIAGFIAG